VDNQLTPSFDNGLPLALFWLSYFDKVYWLKLGEERLKKIEYLKVEDDAGLYIQLSDIPLDHKLALLKEDGTYQLWDDSDEPPGKYEIIQIKTG